MLTAFIHNLGRASVSNPLNIMTASFSKYISKSRAKRLPLTTKRVPRGYKKGYGARTAGRISSKAVFIPIKELQTELVVPDLTNFKLKPYVAPGAKRHIIDTKPDLDAKL